MGFADYETFLMFGDSITEYSFDQYNQYLSSESQQIHFSFSAALQNSYRRKLQVLLRGFAGYNSRDGVPLIKSILKTDHDELPETQRIKLAYVFLGTNDARLKGSLVSNNEHVPLEDYIDNMKSIVNEFQTRNIPVFIITPGIHDSKQWDAFSPEDILTGDCRSNENNKLYQDALVKTFEGIVPVLPLYDTMVKYIEQHGSEKARNGDYSELLTDGIHFTSTGYKILYDAVLALINTHFPHLSPTSLPYKFPYWRTLTDTTFADMD